MEKNDQLQNPLQFASPPSSQFTDADLEAAEHLIHLSESSGGAPGSSFSDSSTSTRSVNLALGDVAEDDNFLWRKNKRCRLISDLYVSTVQIEGPMNKENKKREE